MISIKLPAFLTALCLIQPGVAMAQLSPSAQRGLTFARANCSLCHAVEQVGASPLQLAPPFRELQRRFPVESLRRPLMEGVRTSHQNMPEFRLDPGQATDVIEYLKTLTP
jgi:mono/diheme cytochrome c family protein